MIRTPIDAERGQSRHDDHPRYVLPRSIVKMQVFYNNVVAAEDNCVAAGIAGTGIGKLGQLARSVGSQPYRLVSCARFTDPNIAGEGGSLPEVDYVPRRQ